MPAPEVLEKSFDEAWQEQSDVDESEQSQASDDEHDAAIDDGYSTEWFEWFDHQEEKGEYTAWYAQSEDGTEVSNNL